MSRENRVGKLSFAIVPAKECRPGCSVYFHWGSKAVLEQLTVSGKIHEEHFKYFTGGLEEGISVSTNLVDSAHYIRKHEGKEGGGELVVLLVDSSVKMVHTGERELTPNWLSVPFTELVAKRDKISFTHLNLLLKRMIYTDGEFGGILEALTGHRDAMVRSKCLEIIKQHEARPHSPHAELLISPPRFEGAPAAEWLRLTAPLKENKMPDSEEAITETVTSHARSSSA
ncbi:MAG: hypothetical protein P1U63_05185 [Coxiellaceae bacterium]|nr:hypothetical protein [Coxiellaceae bacterium]